LDARTVLGYLEAVADQLGVEIRYEPMEGETALSPGGLCRIRDKQVIIVNSKAPPGDQVGTFVKALRRLDLSQIYLRPGIRDLLEGDTAGEEGTG
jgi:hypothetical protein